MTPKLKQFRGFLIKKTPHPCLALGAVFLIVMIFTSILESSSSDDNHGLIDRP